MASLLPLAACEDGQGPPEHDGSPDGRPDGRDGGSDTAPAVDAGDDAADGGSIDASADVADAHDGVGYGCTGPGPGCTCVIEPRDAAASCWHTLGGRYGPRACSESYQCCDGAWRAGTGLCGECSCTETTGEEGCVAEGEGNQVCFTEFDGSSSALSEELMDEMSGVSWRPGCPVDLLGLSLLEMPYWGFDGEIHRGRMVVAMTVAPDVLRAFERIYDARFPIERMELIDAYDGSDDLSMADNNTSAFNCRSVTGGTAWSQHSYGDAIDINPVQNPYVIGSTVLPPGAAAFVDRESVRPGMVVEPGPVVAAFDAIGWGWGGRWSSPLDYQHFSANGR